MPNKNIDLYEYFISSPYFAGLGSDTPEEKEFLSSFNKLPSKIKSLLVSENSAVLIYSLKESASLKETQIEQLASVAREVLIGKLFIGKMVETIQDKLGADQQKAKDIANNIVSNLFTSAIEDIKAIQKRNFPEGGDIKPDPIIASQRGYRPQNEDNVLNLRK
jgi:hypothetical protein